MKQVRAGTTSFTCSGCRYYLITWDARSPHGCRAHAFKSKKLPALEVFEASGLECMLFAPKPQRTPTNELESIVDSASFSNSP